jgi:hypothetical protein
MSITALIEEAKQAYTVARLDCGDALLPPANEAAVTAIGVVLAYPVPGELREVYRVHGGQQYVSPGVTGLFGEHRLLAPAEVIEHHRIFAKNCLLDPEPVFPPAPNEWGYWVPELIPFASWDAYDLCVHANTGEVWEFTPETGLIRYRPSIAAVLREVIDAVRATGQAQLGTLRGPS